MPSYGPVRSLSVLLAFWALTACGGERPGREEEPAAEAEAEAAPGPDQPAAPAGPQPAGEVPLAVEDIDRWQKGMAAELEAVQAAGQKLESAATGEDTLSAMMGVQEMATLDAGAAAAGVDRERYRAIRSDLSAAASYMTPELGGIDTTMLSPDQRAEMKRMNEAQLEQLQSRVPPEVLEALRPRAAELRRQELALVAERMKGAGMR